MSINFKKWVIAQLFLHMDPSTKWDSDCSNTKIPQVFSYKVPGIDCFDPSLTSQQGILSYDMLRVCFILSCLSFPGSLSVHLSWACHQVPHPEPILPLHLAHCFLPLFLQVMAAECHPSTAVTHTGASSAGATLQLTWSTYHRNKVKGTERSCSMRATGRARDQKAQAEEEPQEPEKVACFSEKWVAPGIFHLDHIPPCFSSWYMHSILTPGVRSDSFLQAEGKCSITGKGVRMVGVDAYPAPSPMQDYSKIL